MAWFLYLIECKDGSIYTGITVDVEARYAAHASGKGARYTRSHPPRRLLTTVEYPDRSTASKAEYQMKQLTADEKRTFCALRTKARDKLGVFSLFASSWHNGQMSKQYSAACERNRDPILSILREVLADRQTVLEIGSGTGQHAVYFGEQLPHLRWQTSDRVQNHPSIHAWLQEVHLPNVLPPLALDVESDDWPEAQFDAVFSANTCHIMPWSAVQAMFTGIGQVLQDGGVVCIYGPFNYDGAFTSASNAQFDASLKAQAAHMGIRDFEAVDALAGAQGLTLQADHAMPANNRLLVWRRT